MAPDDGKVIQCCLESGGGSVGEERGGEGRREEERKEEERRGEKRRRGEKKKRLVFKVPLLNTRGCRKKEKTRLIKKKKNYNA